MMDKAEFDRYAKTRAEIEVLKSAVTALMLHVITAHPRDQWIKTADLFAQTVGNRPMPPDLDSVIERQFFLRVSEEVEEIAKDYSQTLREQLVQLLTSAPPENEG